MKRFQLLLPVVLLVFVACNNQESKKEGSHDNHQQSEMKDEQMDNKGEHEETAAKVQLDNGKMEGQPRNHKRHQQYVIACAEWYYR